MLGKVVFGREREKGGHFAAHRVSDVLAGYWSYMYGERRTGFRCRSREGLMRYRVEIRRRCSLP